ncbi:hypothetical protein [Fluviispira multicolorata]|uniref:Uncharacterized protein n=1 Tax=Fluviispira multicolorata TaxID=2654512 RepID=A0A833JDV4_9BACT|nr:hypothetical protein [Fluviispira multicolorata]KAB8031757.1 hypothetical protein GCL57_03715 [Fluviispira multicolorata]
MLKFIKVFSIFFIVVFFQNLNASTLFNNLNINPDSSNIFRINVLSAYQFSIDNIVIINSVELDVDQNSVNGFSQLPTAKFRIYQDKNNQIGSVVTLGTLTDKVSAYIPYSDNDKLNAFFKGESIVLLQPGKYWIVFSNEAANVDYFTLRNFTTSSKGLSFTGKAGYLGDITYNGYIPHIKIDGNTLAP